MSEVLDHFDLNNGSNYKTLISRAEEDGIDLDSLRERTKKIRAKRSASTKKIPLKEILVENSTYSRTNLKIRLREKKLLEYKCSECGLTDEWQGKKLSLQLDHINGVNNDNRLENLRFICPNCHSQTDTFAGRKLRIEKIKTKQCLDCQALILDESIRCLACARKENVKHMLKLSKLEKVVWPSDKELQKLLWEKPVTALAAELNCSDNAINKRARKLGLTKPNRGYWQKKKAGKL